MPQLRLLRRILSRRTCLYVVGASCIICFAVCAVGFGVFFFGVAFPMRRAYWLETDYQRAMREANQLEKRAPKGTAPAQRIQPLVQDVPPLHGWNAGHTRVYSTWLGLNADGTGSWMSRGGEHWIYLGGTAQEDSREGDTTIFRHRYRKSTCTDPAYICNMYNEAFNRVADRWFTTFRYKTSLSGRTETLLRYADCDVSPHFCTSSHFGLGAEPVHLVHLKMGEPCAFDGWAAGMHGRCTVTWRFIALPADKMPWTRQIRVPLDKGGSTVVPAFPDAEEQLWNLMAVPGAVDALHYRTNDSDTRSRNAVITVQPGANGTVRSSAYLGLNTWAMFRDWVDNPLDLPEFPLEAVVKCYVERYVDILLRLWDGAADVVKPRSCKGVEKEKKRARAEREASIRDAMRMRDEVEAEMVRAKQYADSLESMRIMDELEAKLKSSKWMEVVRDAMAKEAANRDRKGRR